MTRDTSALDDELLSHAQARKTWADLPREDQARLRTYVGLALTAHGRVKRAREVAGFLDLGPEVIARWLSFPSTGQDVAAMEMGDLPPTAGA